MPNKSVEHDRHYGFFGFGSQFFSRLVPSFTCRCRAAAHLGLPLSIMNIVYNIPPEHIDLLRRFESNLKDYATSIFMTTLGLEWRLDPEASGDIYFDLFTRSKEPNYLAYFSAPELARLDCSSFLERLSEFSRKPPMPTRDKKLNSELEDPNTL